MKKQKNKRLKKNPKTKRKTTITAKQITFHTKIKDNPSNKTLKALALESDYSKAMSEQPSNIIAGKGFQALLAQDLPDTKLTSTHSQGLKATSRYYYHNSTGLHYKVSPDYSTRHKYLETGYKLKGKLNTTTEQQAVTINQLHISNKDFTNILARLTPPSPTLPLNHTAPPSTTTSRQAVNGSFKDTASTQAIQATPKPCKPTAPIGGGGGGARGSG